MRKCASVAPQMKDFPQTAFRLLLLQKRNQFLRLFLFEREIIVNALFSIKVVRTLKEFVRTMRQRYEIYLDKNETISKKRQISFTSYQSLGHYMKENMN